MTCQYCGKLTTNPKYCSVKCSQTGSRNAEYHTLTLKNKKELLWKEQGKKCNRCDFNLYGPKDGPYEIHHKDGDFKNRVRVNEELLCCNCHFMTKNYRFKGRHHTLETRQKISRSMRKSNVSP